LQSEQPIRHAVLTPDFVLLLQLFKELVKSDSADYVGCLQPAAEDSAVGTPTANGTGAQDECSNAA
jgi:hypothetical protein